MEIPPEVRKWLEDPVVLGAAAVLVLILLVLAAKRLRGGQGKAAEDARARGRRKLVGDLRSFRDDLKRAVQGAEPVFRKIDSETEHAAVIGHWRKQTRHRIGVRGPDFGVLKTAARGLGIDAMPLSDLEAAWRKMDREIAAYNGGKLDDSKTPISTVRQFEKDLQKVVVLANICLQKYGG